MVTSIGGTSASQAAYATRTVSSTQSTSGTEQTSPAVTQDVAESSADAAVPSAESLAAARLGDQLGAQADAARVQRAVDESTAQPVSTEETTQTTETADGEATQATAQAAGGQAPAAAGGAGGAGGAAASSGTSDADYIAEADTNSDKTVSDEERAVYEAKQERQAEEAAAKKKELSGATDPAQARTAEVRSAYVLDGETAPALDITA